MARFTLSVLTVGIPLGINSVMTLQDPLSAYSRYGVSPPMKSGPSPFLYAKTARDAALGLISLGLKFQGNESAAKLVLIVTGLVGMADGYIVWLAGGGEKVRDKALGHWLPSAAVILGAILF